MKKTRILFVCKYNRFRSRVAEFYFKKINKNKNIVVTSAGLIEGFLPLDKPQIKAAETFGFSILGKPKTTSIRELEDQDRIIVVANDIPKKIFNNRRYNDKVIIWKIPDVLEGGRIRDNRRVIQAIIKKVDKLNKELEKKKWKQ